MSAQPRSLERRPLETTAETTMHKLRAARTGLIILGVALYCFAPAATRAALLATATVATSSTTAPYDYTITLHNTGTTDIGTFWFSWTDTPTFYDFLPSAPTVTNMPAGWVAPLSHNAIPGDGYGIEFYNLSGSAIPPGNSATFQFTSPDSPTIIGGNAFIPPNKVTTSFIYGGLPLSGPSFEFNATLVPEPSSALLAGAGVCLGLLACWRRRCKTIAAC
jgi:hypothetical protein